MSNNGFQIIDSANRKACVQFDRNPDMQLEMLRDELAKALLETHLSALGKGEQT